MPTTLTNGIQLPDKGSVDWYGSMQSNYNLIDTHLGDTDTHVTAEDKANWNSKQGSLSQAQLDAIAQVATNTSDIATLQSGKANASHTHSSSDITDIGDYATKQYVDNSISGLVDNAPAALDTLKELSTALNDDANFASTVTTALSAKANSADLATVATSGSYNDLSNKPSIPTKTSDLTNDSNFVDTSNSAVASGITSAKVTSYDSHVADTDIHVTTADKNKWNNGVSQAYVFRYSSTALVASSTNSNTLLDNTDNLKVGDKVIDSSGVLFSITAIDTQNSTFTIGTALIDLAKDSDVMHLSGNETAAGIKTFSDDTFIKTLNHTEEVASQSSSGGSIMALINTITYGDSSPSVQARLNFRITADGTKSFYPHENNQYSLGLISRRLKEIHAYSLKVISDINGINPGALSFPDLDNGIDISSYITHLDKVVNNYTPPANGWLNIRVKKTSSTHSSLMMYQTGGLLSSYETTEFSISGTNLPVIANQNVEIYIVADSLTSAKFYPCLGNV